MPFSLARDDMKPADAGLIYVECSGRGWTRKPYGNGFTYQDADGNTLTGEARERAEALVLPPAWTDVWICEKPDGHLQATGVDEAGRTQYRYHPDWRLHCEQVKFSDMKSFGEALPRLRKHVREVLDNPQDHAELATAAIVRILDKGALRIGSERYAETGAFGASTLYKRHVRQTGDDTVRLKFKGKGGKQQEISICDASLVAAVSELQCLKGQSLFNTPDGHVGSTQVNRFIQRVADGGFTAKDFRTWGGSVAAIKALRKGADSIKAVSEAAADHLGNTPTIARNSYIHPRVIEMARDGETPDAEAGPVRLRKDERRLFAVLEAAEPGE
ncbi:DNA topoisomerase IB [Henriciella litoralis]|uniref:DNA topoisomerase IB n=1 Tax=Henriciella litoralis TaxID=568102 RepID=UPI000A0325B7|nr:DNA topoisomerase IB [Henriciella litoralis]